METISCLFHRRATALPLAAKVTSTKRLTETAWQPTAHAAVRLGPDSPLEPTSRAQSKKEMRALVPCPALTLPSSALAEAGHRASPHGHIVSDALSPRQTGWWRGAERDCQADSASCQAWYSQS